MIHLSTEQTNMLEGVKNGILRKFPLLGVTMSKLTFEPTDKIPTAATDGERVLYNEKFVQSLTYDQKVFVFSHEIMHVAFDHIMRSKGKDPALWNQATDAVINQMLKAENLPMIDGGVDMAEAISKSAEEMYEKLLKQKQEQQNKDNSNEQQDKLSGEGQNEQPQSSQAGHDSHEMWEDAIKKAEQQQSAGQSPDSQGSQADSGEDTTQDSTSMQQAERQFNKANQKLKEQIGRQIREQLQKQKMSIQEGGTSSGGYESAFNGVGVASSVLSWKKILRRELEKEEDRWSYRRASEDNDYQARIGTLEVEDYPETEVMLDVSGSVDNDFLKGFLRQLKPLLKESKLRVGCFDEFVYPFAEIKTTKDIDNFKITRKSMWTENWDSAVRAFSKKKGVNKIIFTDGWPCPGVMPKQDLKNVNVIWLVFENQNFKPCCGKVIYINRRELDFLSSRPQDRTV